jgi:hypothetical protein
MSVSRVGPPHLSTQRNSANPLRSHRPTHQGIIQTGTRRAFSFCGVPIGNHAKRLHQGSDGSWGRSPPRRPPGGSLSSWHRTGEWLDRKWLKPHGVLGPPAGRGEGQRRCTLAASAGISPRDDDPGGVSIRIRIHNRSVRSRRSLTSVMSLPQGIGRTSRREPRHRAGPTRR